MYAPIFVTASASSAVKALIGSNPVRLYLFGDAPQGVTKPYVVWQTISGVPENYISQVPDIDSYTIQVDIYADTASSARAVAKELRDVIEQVAHIVRWGGESRDDETNNYRFSFDVDWFVYR